MGGNSGGAGGGGLDPTVAAFTPSGNPPPTLPLSSSSTTTAAAGATAKTSTNSLPKTSYASAVAGSVSVGTTGTGEVGQFGRGGGGQSVAQKKSLLFSDMENESDDLQFELETGAHHGGFSGGGMGGGNYWAQQQQLQYQQEQEQQQSRMSNLGKSSVVGAGDIGVSSLTARISRLSTSGPRDSSQMDGEFESLPYDSNDSNNLQYFLDGEILNSVDNDDVMGMGIHIGAGGGVEDHLLGATPNSRYLSSSFSNGSLKKATLLSSTPTSTASTSAYPHRISLPPPPDFSATGFNITHPSSTTTTPLGTPNHNFNLHPLTPHHHQHLQQNYYHHNHHPLLTPSSYGGGGGITSSSLTSTSSSLSSASRALHSPSLLGNGTLTSYPFPPTTTNITASTSSMLTSGGSGNSMTSSSWTAGAAFQPPSSMSMTAEEKALYMGLGLNLGTHGSGQMNGGGGGGVGNGFRVLQQHQQHQQQLQQQLQQLQQQNPFMQSSVSHSSAALLGGSGSLPKHLGLGSVSHSSGPSTASTTATSPMSVGGNLSSVKPTSSTSTTTGTAPTSATVSTAPSAALVNSLMTAHVASDGCPVLQVPRMPFWGTEGTMHIPYRHWKKGGTEKADNRHFMVMSYNVLAPTGGLKVGKGEMEGGEKWLDWEFRKRKILDEIAFYSPDFVCLQVRY
jgi:hypothetical protein